MKGTTMKKQSTIIDDTPMRPALTPEARENQLIALAVNLAEQQLRDGTASSQVITHYLKLGSSKEKLEQDILKEQKKMIIAKTESLQSEKRFEELFQNALDAFTSYGSKIISPDNKDVP